jgi:DNA invertase Pin-like site-specific DNA recombinase
MKKGYARISTQDQNPDLQRDALKDLGGEKIFNEKIARGSKKRPKLEALNISEGRGYTRCMET